MAGEVEAGQPCSTRVRLRTQYPGVCAEEALGARSGYRAGHLPVHNSDIRLLIIQQFLPQALSQEVHTLLLYRPATKQDGDVAGTGSDPEFPRGLLSDHGALIVMKPYHPSLLLLQRHSESR